MPLCMGMYEEPYWIRAILNQITGAFALSRFFM